MNHPSTYLPLPGRNEANTRARDYLLQTDGFFAYAAEQLYQIHVQGVHQNLDQEEMFDLITFALLELYRRLPQQGRTPPVNAGIDWKQVQEDMLREQELQAEMQTQMQAAVSVPACSTLELPSPENKVVQDKAKTIVPGTDWKGQLQALRDEQEAQKALRDRQLQAELAKGLFPEAKNVQDDAVTAALAGPKAFVEYLVAKALTASPSSSFFEGSLGELHNPDEAVKPDIII